MDTCDFCTLTGHELGVVRQRDGNSLCPCCDEARDGAATAILRAMVEVEGFPIQQQAKVLMAAKCFGLADQWMVARGVN